MKLTSSAFKHGEYIPRLYTCDGSNINPPLEIHDAPEGTQSFALIMEDPDVPKHIREDRMWDHWVIFNIPRHTTQIIEGQEPPCLRGIGTGHNVKYYGPCPPDGEHRYFFKLFALDTMLDLAEKATKHQLEIAMKNHIIAKTELMGIYGRS